MAVIDTRSRVAPAPRLPALADPSGRRARVLKRAGCALAIILALWVVGLLLAGLEVLPAADVPLGQSLVGSGDSPVRHTLPGTFRSAGHRDPVASNRPGTGAASGRPPGADSHRAALTRHRGGFGATRNSSRASGTRATAGSAATPSRAGRTRPGGSAPASGQTGRSAYRQSGSAAGSRSTTAPSDVRQTTSARSGALGHTKPATSAKSVAPGHTKQATNAKSVAPGLRPRPTRAVP